MGFPDVKLAKSWLDKDAKVESPPEVSVHMNSLKNSEIPVLEDYSETAEDDFWNKFPKRELPRQATTRIDVGIRRQHV